MKENLKKYDAAVIGFGKDDKTTARVLGAAGKTIALIECSSMMYGGICISMGYIPTKSLVYRAGLATAVGRISEGRSAAYREAMEQKEDLIGRLRGKNYQKLDSNPDTMVINRNVRFVSLHIVKVMYNEDVFQVEGEMISTDMESRAFILPVEDLKDNLYIYTSKGLLSRGELPEKLMIIDGGCIGVGSSSIYANSSSKVIILQDGDALLPREDEEIAAVVEASLENRGIRVLVGVKVKAAEQGGDGAVVAIDTKEGERRLQADAALIATGCRPNTRGPNLEATGVKTDTRGSTTIDDILVTITPHTYTIGDVRGGLQFTYILLDDFRIVGPTILGDGNYDLKKRGAAPCSVSLNPPFSRVGLSEKETVKAGRRVKTAGLVITAIPKTQVPEQPTGLLKTTIDEETGLTLGAYLFCGGPYEMMNMIKLVTNVKVSHTVLWDTIYTHPTMSEALNDLFVA